MVRAEPRAASRLAAHGPRDSHKVDPRDFSQSNSPDAYKDGSATYVDCAQQGQYPTFARCAMSRRGDVRSRGVVPAERSSAEFSASHIFSAAWALRWTMRERPELCIRIHRGGNANLPRAVRTVVFREAGGVQMTEVTKLARLPLAEGPRRTPSLQT